MAQEPFIASFVVRLFHLDPGAGEAVPWRVVVRHVQTGEEQRFHRLADALAYMEQFTAGRPKPPLATG